MIGWLWPGSRDHLWIFGGWAPTFYDSHLHLQDLHVQCNIATIQTCTFRIQYYWWCYMKYAVSLGKTGVVALTGHRQEWQDVQGVMHSALPSNVDHCGNPSQLGMYAWHPKQKEIIWWSDNSLTTNFECGIWGRKWKLMFDLLLQIKCPENLNDEIYYRYNMYVPLFL